MFIFANQDNETDAGTLELDGASSVVSTDVGGFTYVFVAGSVDDGISVFRLNLDGSLTPVADVTDGGTLELDGATGLSTAMVDGNTYLFAAGSADSGVSVFLVGVNGSLTAVTDVVDDGTIALSGVTDTATAQVGTTTYLFAAGATDDGISVFRVAGDGKLTSVSTLGDSGAFELGGVTGLATAVIGGNTFLFAAGSVDDGVSIFQIAADGTLTHTSSVTDDGTLELDGASDVATAAVGGVTYLFVAGANDNGVSVFSVNSSGILTNVGNTSDSASLRLAGATGVSVSVFGTTTYLTVGGAENGASVFRVNTGGTLTAMDNIDDAGSRELAGTTAVHTATVGGTSYIIGAGSTDDGISTFGLKPSGQLWFTTEGGDADTRIVRINNDGSSQTVVIDNTPATDPLPSSFQADVGLDTAAGFYFGLSNSGVFGDNAFLVRGVIGSSATPTIVVDFPDSVITNGIQVDAINHKIYLGYQDGSGTAPANTGIRQYSYNPLTGAIADQGFLVTSASDTRGQESGFDLLDPRDFALDSSIGRVFYTELLTGGAASVGLFRLDLADPNTTTQLVSQAQFPDNGSNGYIYDVEVDQTTDLVYFSTESQAPSPDGGYNASQNAIWYISENASSGTATKLTLVGAVGATFYPGDMTFDQSTRQLYVESEEGGSGSADDVIYVFQLNGAGTTATLINTFYPSPTFVSSGANIQGMVFSQLPTLSNLNGTATQPAEQAGAGTVLLTGAPTITDTDGDHLSGATVQITGGKFSSNETSNADDHLGVGAALQISGTIAGTNITVSWNASTETLTLTGYDTLANYQAVLAAVCFWSTGDNPTNYGLNTTRTITWTVSDGTPDIPGGAINSGTTTVTLSAVNDAPVNGSVSSASGNEDANIAVTGLQVSDADTNPAITDVTVTLSVTKGVLTVLTNVTSGLTSGDVSGNGTATVTLTGTLNEINATLSAASGLRFTGNASVNGTDTLTVVTDDGALSDTDNYTITITAANDAPIVAGDGTETAATILEDTPSTTGQTVAELFGGQYSDALDQVAGGSSTDPLAGMAVVANGSSAATGFWQYFDTGSSTWIDIAGTSAAAAQLLAAGTAIRFNPAVNFNGAAPTLTVHLVDGSGGALTSGTTVDLSAGGATGGTTRYSTGTVVLDGNVTAGNDAATIIGDTTGDVTEAGGIANGTAGTPTDTGNLDATDPDNAADAWQTVAPGTASLGGFGTYALTAAGVWTYTVDDTDPAVQALNGAATLTDTFNALTEDGTTQLVTVTIHAQNDAPALDLDASGAGTGFTTTFTGPAVAIADSDDTIIDPDNATITQAVITLTNMQAGDTLAINGALPGGITSNVVVGVNTITVTLSNAASAADYATAIKQVVFSNPGTPPNTVDRNITVVVNDGTDNGNIANALIHVAPLNHAPTAVSFSNVHGPFAENTSTAAAIKVADIAVTDVDGGANVLSLAGADGARFEIIGSALWLKAGAKLDFETNPVLDVTVNVNGIGVGIGIDASRSLAIAVTNVIEAINGTNGPDILVGASGADIINGFGGNDLIWGFGGDDRITGGLGADIMKGGDGRDVFVYLSTSHSAPGRSGLLPDGTFSPGLDKGLRDIIGDFTHGVDDLDFSAIDANTAVAGNQAFVWKGAANFTAAGQLISRQFNFAGTAGDKTIVYGDINGDAKADFQVELSGLKVLGAGDFVL